LHLDIMVLAAEQHAIFIQKLGLYPLNWLWRLAAAASGSGSAAQGACSLAARCCARRVARCAAQASSDCY
jgi:hypothetical protein